MPAIREIAASGAASWLNLARVLALVFACCCPLLQAAEPASQEVEFEGRAAALFGTAYLPPQNAQPVAGLVLLHGSNKEHSLRMHALGEALARDGFAVLTYDKRGAGRSQGVFQDADDEAAFTLLAEDAVAAVHALRAQPRMRKVPIGLLGVSQGGWVAPLAVARSSSIAFMVLWSGPVCSVSEELHFGAFARGIADFSIYEYSREVREHMRSVPRRASDFDPRSALLRVSIPALWVFGARDNSIPVELSIERLEALIRQGKHNFEYRVLPQAQHSLDYPDRATLDWIRQRAGARAR